MSCPAPDHVLDYLGHRLERSAIDELEAHVDGCVACRELFGELARSTELDAIVASSEPTRVGRYRIDARLGEGGMGTVYAAHDPQLDRKVAIKLVHAELAERGGVDRLLREGRALAKLSHENVVAVHDADVDDGVVYLAMALVEGETLASWLQTPRSWREIVAAFASVARGLAAAHRAGIVHRDVKPENVIVEPDGGIKVVDFGLAGSRPSDDRKPEGGAEDDARLTLPGSVIGTHAMMSPEQRRGDEVGPATDQYSLCVGFAAALAGVAGVPRRIRAAIDRGRAEQPADRFASLDDFVAAIAPRRRWPWWLAGGAVAVAVAIAGYILATRGDDATTRACRLAALDRAELWTDAHRRAAAAALHATGLDYADDTARRIDAALVVYLEELARAERAICELRDDALVATGLACLAERRSAFFAVEVQLLTSGPDEARSGVALVHTLPAVDECANPTYLASTAAAATSAPERAAIAAAVHAARAASAAGDYRAAVAHAREAVTRARVSGGMLLAGALAVLGDELVTTEGATVAEATFREAIAVAETAHADEIRAYAMAELMAVLAREPGREREALAMQSLVEAAGTRVAKPAVLAPVIRQSAGVAKLRLGELDAALVDLQASLAGALASLPPHDPRLAAYLNPVGVALSSLGREAEAVKLHDEAVRVATDVWGPDHPTTALFVANLAGKHATLGDCDRAVVEATHARAILAGAVAADTPELLDIGRTIAACALRRRDFDGALREHAAIRSTLEANGRTNSDDMARAWIDIGDTQRARSAWDPAGDAYRTAISIFESIVGTSDARLAAPLVGIGEVEISAGRPARAIPALERALAIREATHATALQLAEVQWPLAYSLGAQDPARARRLAEAAYATLAAAGPDYAAYADEAKQWLAGKR
jgi:hypothetical protein